MPPVTLIVVGAGSRGNAYGDYALAHPDDVRIVGVADPRNPRHSMEKQVLALGGKKYFCLHE